MWCGGNCHGAKAASRGGRGGPPRFQAGRSATAALAGLARGKLRDQDQVGPGDRKQRRGQRGDWETGQRASEQHRPVREETREGAQEDELRPPDHETRKPREED